MVVHLEGQNCCLSLSLQEFSTHSAPPPPILPHPTPTVKLARNLWGPKKTLWEKHHKQGLEKHTEATRIWYKWWLSNGLKGLVPRWELLGFFRVNKGLHSFPWWGQRLVGRWGKLVWGGRGRQEKKQTWDFRGKGTLQVQTEAPCLHRPRSNGILWKVERSPRSYVIQTCPQSRDWAGYLCSDMLWMRPQLAPRACSFARQHIIQTPAHTAYNS